MAAKKGFVIYFDWREQFELLPLEDRGRLLMALLDYGESGRTPDLHDAVGMAFSFMRAQMDRDATKYAERCAIKMCIRDSFSVICAAFSSAEAITWA